MRTLFSRVLLLVLAGVALFAVIRMLEGPDDSDVLVTFGRDIDLEHVEHRGFAVEQPIRLAIHAVGSFETDSTLAALGWIIERDSGKVVWQMDPGGVERGRGTLATANDTLQFLPGVYDAYFASHGDPLNRPVASEDGSFFERLGNVLSRDGRLWHGDAERWRFQIDFTDLADQQAARRLSGDERDPEDNLRVPEGLVWRSGPARNNDVSDFLFEVTAPTTLHVQSTGEVVDGRARDTGFLMRLGARDTLWTLADAASTWAGGSLKNRTAEVSLSLDPGIYRAGYRTDRRHAYHRWDANPPLVPVSWGITLTTDDVDLVAALDPWERLPRIASFACVGEDELREDTFILPDTTAVLLAATGEIIGSSEYDFATLFRERISPSGPQPPEEIWTMTRSNSRPAGGADKNREAEAVLTLMPATYTLRYVTDDSHDCSDFNADPPVYPDRWGATLFALDTGFDVARVERPDPFEIDRELTAVLDESEGAVLAQITRVRNSAERSTRFTLDAPASVRVYAIGEILPSGAYDYAWITNDDNDDTIWEMTRENTRWAGGSKKNRVFDGTLDLRAGRYEVHFETDGSHAYGDFDQAPPNDPEHWGVTVLRLPSAPPLPELPLPELPPEPPAAPVVETTDAK